MALEDGGRHGRRTAAARQAYQRRKENDGRYSVCDLHRTRSSRLRIDIPFQFLAAQSMEHFHRLDCSSLKIGKEPVITRFFNFAGRASGPAELPLFLTDVSSGFFALTLAASHFGSAYLDS
jgi:hypothetical protein